MARRFVQAALLAMVAAAVPAWGAGKEPAREEAPTKPRRTVLHFGEDDIRGALTRPDGELVQAPRKVTESSLLRMRRSFVDRALSGVAHGESR
ncbi:MAG: hypothetical protein ACJ787_09820 [Myxococcales bacterium]